MAVEILNRRRGQIKAQMTRFENFLDSDESENVTEINQIEDLAGNRYAENEEEYIRQRETFENQFYKLQVQALEKIDQLSGNRVQEAQSVVSINEHALPDRRVNIKLPRIELSKFNGDFDKWLQFKDSFTSLIHDNGDLLAVQKLQYLRSSLQGETMENICALKTTEENYEIAWEILLNRYENPRKIVNSHVKKLLNQPSVTKGDLNGLRHFINCISINLRELASLGQLIEHWDAILILIMVDKLDDKIQQDWNKLLSETGDQELPTINELQKFLERQCDRLEAAKKTPIKNEVIKMTASKRPSKHLALATTVPHSCEFCSGPHYIYRCGEFLKLSIAEKISAIKSKRLCMNYLGMGHFAIDCKASTYKKFSRNHNTLLHIVTNKDNSDILQVSTGVKGNKEQIKDSDSSKVIPLAEDKNYSLSMYCKRPMQQVILSTVQVLVNGSNGKQMICRALLDPGSQSNLITTEFIKKLGLQTKVVSIPVNGINMFQTNVKQSATIKIKALQGNYETALDCLVLLRITEKLPQVRINTELVNIPDGIILTDPFYYESREVDLLIGAGLFWQLLSVGQIKTAKGLPVLQKTKLGWILGGELTNTIKTPTATSCHLVTNNMLSQQLERFWSQENCSENSDEVHNKWDEACEKHFIDTFKRDSDGRFVVELPKVENIILGESKQNAMKRLNSLERKLEKDPTLKKEYSDFMKEYNKLGHMTLIKDSPLDDNEKYYIPHQAIVRPGSLTTKLRVVFDALTKTQSGYSLNDKLLAGANLQGDLMDIILRFRSHKYVITADVEKMYRQIMVSEKDRNLQRIPWREERSDSIQTFQLNTITYGTTSAPFLALRCLKQLAVDDGKEYPLVARALNQNCYMDDILTGTDELKDTIMLREQLTQLLARGQFNLRKWRSNNSQILSTVTMDKRAPELLIIDDNEAIKTLGILWDAKQDVLQYKVTITKEKRITKRSILSRMAQIYDPLGLVGPVIIIAKMLIQQLWQEKLDWDESLPQYLHTAWKQYHVSLPKLNKLRIERNINLNNSAKQFEVFGFCDASEKAYGACLYGVYLDEGGKTQSHLICSKSRVASLRTLSIPRLELLAAVLLSELLVVIKKSFKTKLSNIYCWSDSTILLQWIKTPSNQLKTFVANRVAKIQALTTEVTWYHVPTGDNPADILSRGTKAEELLEATKWWKGPAWLIEGDWPEQPKILQEQVPEKRNTVTLTVTCKPLNVFYRFSSWQKLCRVIAYCNRFIMNIRKSNLRGPLIASELNKAEKFIVYMAQTLTFHQEFKDLKSKQTVSKGSRLAALDPFLDKDDLIRVGGRLRQAAITAAKSIK